MAGPWEKYAAPADSAKPWERYGGGGAGASTSTAAPPEDPTSIGNLAGAATEPLASLATGAVAAPLSGLAGIAGAVLPGPPGQGAAWARGTGEALTYQPRTIGAQNAMKVISYPFEKLAEAAEATGGIVSDITGSPALGAGVNAAMQVGPQLLGAKGAGMLRNAPGVLPKLTSEVRPGAQAMLDKGANLTPGQRFGGGWDRAEQALAKWPLIGAPIRGARARAHDEVRTAAFNDVLDPVGETLPAGLKGHDAVGEVQSVLRSRYDDILERSVGRLGDEAAPTPGTAVAVRGEGALTAPPAPAAPPSLRAELSTLRSMIDNSTLPGKMKKEFGRIIDEDVIGRFQEGGVASGETVKMIDTNLRVLAEKKGRSDNRDVNTVGLAVKEARAALKRMTDRENPELAPELKATDTAWAKFKILQRAAVYAGKNGEFTPAQLERAVKAQDTSKDKARYAEGKANMQQFAKDAREALGDAIPDSGSPYQALVAALSQKGVGLLGLPGGLVGMAALALPYSPLGTKMMAHPPAVGVGAARALPVGAGEYANQLNGPPQ